MHMYLQVLNEELSRRQLRNPRYSLRAFAAALGISPATLSLTLRGKRSLSIKAAKLIVDKISLAPDLKDRFIQSAVFLDKNLESTQNASSKSLENDQFQCIADWHHLAILNLADTCNNYAEIGFIARKLSISKRKAREALERLERLNLIEIKNGRTKQKQIGLSTKTSTPSSAIRRHHRQQIDNALTALDTVNLDLREFGSLTLAINPNDLATAKRLILDFRQKFNQIMSESHEKSEVYVLNMQLFPVTKRG